MNSSFSIIPLPVSARLIGGSPFLFDATTAISANANASLHFIASEASRILAVPLVERVLAGSAILSLKLDIALAASLGPEGYRLTVKEKEIVICGGGLAGVFYGFQTLRQLLPPDIERIDWRANCDKLVLPALEIEDRPRFTWRGALLDTSRHFLPVSEVKKFIDTLALHKLNVLHWHLVDDQGWRIEIKKYPRLTEVGAWRKSTAKQLDEKVSDGIPLGGFYTQDELRDVVAYAEKRFITIMPEIEVPGHSSAALAAYPQFGNTDAPGYSPSVRTSWDIFPDIYAPKPETLRFLDDVFDEVLAIFPSKFIHVGGDEAPKGQWEASAEARAFMRENNLRDGNELQSWFIRRTEKYLAARNRRLIGWDEIQEGGLAANASLMAWRDAKWATGTATQPHDPWQDLQGVIDAARRGHDVVMSPMSFTYFCCMEGSAEEEGMTVWTQLTLRRAYDFEPIPPNLESKYHSRILGAQGQLWSEYMPNRSMLERRAFPRLTALAEVLWSPKEHRDYGDFRKRLEGMLARFDRLDVNYRRPRLQD